MGMKNNPEKALALIKECVAKYPDRLRMAHIESVKMRNPITRNQYTVKDIVFLAEGSNSNKVLCVKAVSKGSESYLLHQDINHYNMNSSTGELDVGEYRIWYSPFCNPVLQRHLWERPKEMEVILKGNLMEGNPNDSWRSISSPDIECRSNFMYFVEDNSRMNSKATLAQVITGSKTGIAKNPSEALKFKTVVTKLLGDHNLRYVCCTKDIRTSSDMCFTLVDRRDIEAHPEEFIVSQYYRQYSWRDVDEAIKITKTPIDIAVIGCGSAGSNIVSQLARTDYFSTMHLIDFDTVEYKNLRNQAYIAGDVGGFKAEALKNAVQRLQKVNGTKVETFRKKFQEAPLEVCKIKYLVVGLDSFSARQQVFEAVRLGRIECEYLIDTRYLDLSSSLFFIDTKDEKQMEYYKELLDEDAKSYDEYVAKQKETALALEWDADRFRDFGDSIGLFKCNCEHYRLKFGIDRREVCTEHNCRSDVCVNNWVRALKEHNIPVPEESSCVHKNFIHIYTLTSSWVTSIIRSIETDEVKPVSHVEITVEPIPNAVIIRR